MALPGVISYCKITGRFLEATADTSGDPDDLPQGNPLVGVELTFKAAPSAIKTSTPPATIIPRVFNVTTDADGYLYSPGVDVDVDGNAPTDKRCLYILASSDPDIEPHDWPWSFTARRADLPTITGSFIATPDGEIDLATVVNVPASPGAETAAWIQAVTAATDARDAAEAARDLAIEAAAHPSDPAVAALIDDPDSQVRASLSSTYVAGAKSAADSETAPLGSELVDATGWTLGAGWSGNYASGFVHTAGSTATLTRTLPSTGTKFYLVTFTVATPTMSTAFTVSIGGSYGPVMYEGDYTSHTYQRGIQSLADGTLTFTPESAFDGTITAISVKEITAATTAPTTYKDSTDATALEQRLTTEALSNIFIGKESGRYNVTGHENVIVGHKSMRTSLSGFWNVALGHQTLEANINGTRNVAAGVYALQANQTGHRNIAIGPFTLRANTHGMSNIAIGADSVWKNTFGNYNIGIGQATLGESVTGNANIAIGHGALPVCNGLSNAVGIGYSALGALVTTAEPPVAVGYRALRDATGGGSVAVGHESLRYQSTGTGNVGIGFQAGYANLTGNQGVAIGYMAGKYNTGGRNTAIGYSAMLGVSGSSTGSRNVVVGDSSGTGMTTASQNTILGSSSGSSLTSGTGNILVGFNTQTPTASDSNFLNIGNTIYGNVSTKRVGINVSAPTAKLHLPASTASASTAPIKMEAGVLMTTPEAGAIEFDGTNLYVTTAAGVRKTLAVV